MTCGLGYLVRGRQLLFGDFLQILIFDVIEVIPEPGKPLTKHKLKVNNDPIAIAVPIYDVIMTSWICLFRVHTSVFTMRSRKGPYQH